MRGVKQVHASEINSTPDFCNESMIPYCLALQNTDFGQKILHGFSEFLSIN